MPTEIEWVKDAERFASLAGEWDSLLPEDSTPFDLHSWYASWWEAFGGAYELSVCTLRDGGGLAGVFPLAHDGRRLRALANEQTSWFRPLARDPDAMEGLVVAVAERASAPFALSGLPERDPCMEQLLAGMRSGGVAALAERAYASPLVDTSGDYEAWRSKTKARWEGSEIQRFIRKMDREHETELSLVEAPGDLEAELTAGFRAEASGWKGRAGTAIASSPQTEAFYRSLARAFHGRGELRLSRIVLDGATVAFDFCLLHRNRLYLLKTGFDEDFRRLGPGLVMRLLTVQRCFELELDAHELLGVESEWKMKFATSTRPHAIVRGYPRRSPSVVRYLYRARLRPHLKAVYRRWRRRRGRSGGGVAGE
jgi:CelD/BcsL family acetyltransferase involved in cellulose biosynthesis